MRKYEPIWRMLKDTGNCRIVAPTYLTKRIKKAVVKEKYNDAKFRDEYTSDLTIHVTPTANQLEVIIEFKLRVFPNYVGGNSGRQE